MPKRDWSRVVAADRKRKRVDLTLSDAARARLRAMAVHHRRGASGVVEDLVMAGEASKGNDET